MRTYGWKRKAGYLLAILSPVWLLGACRHDCGNAEERANKIVSRVAAKLDFTDAQTAKLEELKQLVLAIRKERHEQREAGLNELIGLISAKELDKKKVRDLMEKRRDAFEDDVPAVLDKVAELHALLDDNQKAKIVRFIERRPRCLTP